MNTTNMELLAKALIGDPRYKWQTTPANALRHRTSKEGFYHYTVIGVMADVYATVTKLAYWEDDPDSRFPSKFIMKSLPIEPWRLDIPPEVLAWYGLTREQSTQLWCNSARGFTFKQIGEAILKSIKVERKI